MGLRCKGCGGEEHVKNGFMRGKQRYRCKACGLNFTDTPPRGMPLRVKVEAVLLYLSGLSMNRTAKLLGVSTPSVQAWIERFAEVYAQKPEPEGRAVVVELDEMWHYLLISRGIPGHVRLHFLRKINALAIRCVGHIHGRLVKKSNKLWVWKARDRATDRIIDWELGG